ncbi:MAG: hypothetical protein ACI9JT_002225 [Polaribacter sp.]|jgi:hypothetical protein
MLKYSGINMIATSHSDNREATKGNLYLSEIRQKLTVDYSMFNGFSLSRVKGKGYG